MEKVKYFKLASRYLGVIFTVLVFLDMATTVFGLQMGYAEQNRLTNYLVEKMGLLGVVVVGFATILTIHFMLRRVGVYVKVPVLAALNSIWGLAVIKNVRVII